MITLTKFHYLLSQPATLITRLSLHLKVIILFMISVSVAYFKKDDKTTGILILFQISMILVPVCYGLLMTLTIRGCMGSGGPQGVLALLTPDWNQITKPWYTDKINSSL